MSPFDVFLEEAIPEIMLNELLEAHVVNVSVCWVSEPPIVPVYLPGEIFSRYILVGKKLPHPYPLIEEFSTEHRGSRVHCHL